MNNRLVIFIIVSFIFIEAVFFFLKALKADHNLSILPDTECEIRKTNFNLTVHLTAVPKDSLMSAFPYEIYLDSADWCNIQSIKSDLATLNAFNPENISTNQEIMYIALTDKLFARIEPTLKKYNPDSVLQILHWASKFCDYKDLDTANARVYNAVFSYWFGVVTNHLTGYALTHSSVKYEFKFRYIEGICQSKQYQPSVGNSEFEKVILDSIDSKWAYMFKRFWYGTGFLFKLVVFAGLSVTLYGYFCITQKLIKTIRK